MVFLLYLVRVCTTGLALRSVDITTTTVVVLTIILRTTSIPLIILSFICNIILQMQGVGISYTSRTP